ncbi:2Fe-2S iron-sulfur cluster-binding protein [Pelagicoccus sp. SDUM812005]|uniref:(2Fe-2S)-binding protein n=1 Tax=Pelagicoccus sp. SDUM812005 TaxID=3041257 RepID=UPI00280E033C|nr:2Fe-2S iron-sulfur cluster-binding protein [Pelagicoccus sp. SDUM812005]MDQ8183284.1 (2Fe-2S)-binding protein [Pelagicoccus sp. SDUM812005]
MKLINRDEGALARSPSSEEVAQTSIELRVNGRRQVVAVEPREVLLDTLRERFACTGVKKGCDHGQCGACTILLDGRRVNACLMLSVMAEGCDLRTIEGIASENGELHAMQQAFLDHDAFQCGYCTCGQIVSAVGMLNEPWSADPQSLAESMSGNLCRCGAYRNILAAVSDVKRAGNRREASRDEDL